MESSTHVDAGNEPALLAKPRGSTRQQDPVDKPARRLGAKRSALQGRRHRKALSIWHAGVTRTGSRNSVHVLASCDGTLEFAIHRTAAGLLIEKRICQRLGLRTAQTLCFLDEAGFDRWCELEPLRFEDPLMHAELCRQGHEALGARR